jgi:hypothetical protein
VLGEETELIAFSAEQFAVLRPRMPAARLEPVHFRGALSVALLRRRSECLERAHDRVPPHRVSHSSARRAVAGGIQCGPSNS